MFRSLALAAAITFCTGSAHAQINPEQLATCMTTHTTPSMKANVKQFMIHALQENKPDATSTLLTFSFEALSVATSKCGMSFADVSSPDFEAATKRYGEILGEQIITEAFRSIDIPIN